MVEVDHAPVARAGLGADSPKKEGHRFRVPDKACLLPLETHHVGDLVVVHRRDKAVNGARLLIEEGRAVCHHDREEDEIQDIYLVVDHCDHSHDQTLYREGEAGIHLENH